MEPNQLQQQLFQHIKENLPPHLSLADELGNLLALSPDSIYRRIRGEKPVTLAEIKMICEHYHLSMDQLLQLENDTVAFRAPDLDKKEFPFIDILTSILRQLKYFNTFKSKQILYLCKDMPIWQFYLFPELAAFKTFVWAKSIHNDPEYAGKTFSLEEFQFEDCFAIGRQIITEYNLLPSIELWNEESINSTISQIRFFKESGGFKYVEDIPKIIDSFLLTLDHLKQQAEKGLKFMPGSTDVSYKQSVQLYVNEIVIGSNTIIAELDQVNQAYIPYNVFSFLHTKDRRFTGTLIDGFHTLRRRSTLISSTGEKERNRFFNLLHENVNALR